MRPLAVALVLAGAVSCAPPPTDGAALRARAVVDQLAGTIGSRPLGSPAALRARDAIAATLEETGFRVRLQQAEAVDAANGVTARVSNIIAIKEGTEPDAIALVSHYDSVAEGPGAQDDALGVATCVAAAQELIRSPLRHALIVLVTDGEEAGLMGARAVVQDETVRARVRVFLNFDNTGGSGAPVLFETGPGGGDIMRAWARGAVTPYGASFGTEIYKRLPNDTDFSVLKSIGAAGLNFAAIGGATSYHTARDVAEGVSDATLSQNVVNTIGIVRALDQTALERTEDAPTFFDLGRRVAVVYSARTNQLIGWSACAVGLLVWFVIVRRIVRADGWSGLLVRSAWSLLALAVAVLVMIATTMMIRAMAHDVAPWWSAPLWTAGAVAVSGVLAIAVAAWMFRRWVRRWPAGSALTAWGSALPTWIALTAASLVSAPAAAYLFALPLGAIAALVAVSRSPAWMRVASGLALAVVLALWLDKTVLLLDFLAAMFGWLPMLPPAWLFAVVLTAAGLMIVPPAIAIAAGSRHAGRIVRLVATVAAILVVSLGARAVIGPAYTDARPARRVVRYVQDDIRHQAWWEIGAADSGANPRDDVPESSRWTSGRSTLDASIRLSAPNAPFVFRTAAAPVSAAPVAVKTTTVRADDGELIVDFVIEPRALISARLVLPPGLVPVRSTIAGVVRDGRWMASYVAVPDTGLNVRLALPVAAAADLDRAMAVVSTPGVPAKVGEPLPAWLPAGAATWSARSIYLVSAAPAHSGAGTFAPVFTPFTPPLRDARVDRLCAEALSPDAAPDTTYIHCALDGARSGRQDLTPRSTITIAAWNVGRGIRVVEQADSLARGRLGPVPDVLLLSEADRGCKRSGYRHVARDFADRLGYAYVFAVEFVELPPARPEAGGPICEHGNAIVSRFPIGNVRQIRHAWQERWYTPPSPAGVDERRLGGRVAISVDLRIGGDVMHAYVLHLESRGDEGVRAAQAREIAWDAAVAGGRVVIGGDLNAHAFAADLANRTALDQPTQAFLRAGFADAHSGLDPGARTTAAIGLDLVLDAMFVRALSIARAGVCAEAACAALSDHRLIWSTVDLHPPRHPLPGA